jgi:pimeloyl-ACP methyl ester carboxylesterase
MEKKHELYLFSGLGADKRAYQYLDFSGYQVNYIAWISPLKGETIENYARRLSNKIKTAHPILIGLSFGGLMAIEVSKYIETDQIILISSVKTSKEMPIYFKITGWLGLNKILPIRQMSKPNFVLHWLFGLKRWPDKKLLAEIMNDTDPAFLKWAIEKVSNWNNLSIPKNVKHIHGSNDRVFPISNIQADVIIKKGGHFMIIDKAEELTVKIRQLLKKG